MKGLKIYEAVNEIDDALIEEAKEKPVIMASRKNTAVIAAAALALTIGSLEIAGIVNMPKLSGFSPESPVEEATDDIGVTESAASVHIPETPDETQPPPTAAEPTAISPDNAPNDYDFSGYSLDYWLNSDKVIWGTETVKGSVGSEKLPPGTVKISPELGSIMKGENDDTVYAVLVDFEPCIDKNEMENWEYNGDTIAGLTAERNKLYVYNGKISDYTDSEGDHTEPIYDISDQELFNKLTERIEAVRNAYYYMKLQEFGETFHIKNGMEIYTDPWAEKVLCFYTFGLRSQLEVFVCGESEAFVFYPAQRFK